MSSPDRHSDDDAAHPGPEDAAAPLPTAPDAADELPALGRLLGIDFGTRRLGLALSTPEQNLSTPLEVWSRHDPASDARRLRQVIEEYHVRGIVIGLPLHMGGEEGQSARRAREFGRWVRETLALPVAFWDERCSTAAADDWMQEAGLTREQRRARRDMLAAHVILQSFLDHRRSALTSEAEDRSHSSA